MSFKTILGGFIYSTITKVDHIPSIAMASCYLTCIKHAFKHPHTRTHLYREPCRQTDTLTDRHTHLCREPCSQPDRQTHTHAHAHTFAENHTDRHTRTQTHTHTLMQRTMQPDRQTYTRTSEGMAVVRSIFSWKA